MSGMFNDLSHKQKKLWLKQYPNTSSSVCHQSSTLTYALKGRAAEGDFKPEAHGRNSGT